MPYLIPGFEPAIAGGCLPYHFWLPLIEACQQR